MASPPRSAIAGPMYAGQGMIASADFVDRDGDLMPVSFRFLNSLFNAVRSVLGLSSGEIVVGGGAGNPPTTIPNGQLPATATNDNAAAGNLGEFVANSAGSTSIASNSSTNVTSVSLTAGDWDVRGTVAFAGAGGAVPNIVQMGISATSANFDSGNIGINALWDVSFSANPQIIMPSGERRFSLASTTTIFLVGYINFAPGTFTTTGRIEARRAR